ncbi:MAG: tripartite tricarboxylate transporter substrate binding protein, partial [Propionibacteriales bacterium]|nr:tripartite tricarboxylate transporter substrate binding protein [Propionibacteriales bacterium]
MELHRRAVLKFGLAAGATAALSACGGVKTTGGSSGGKYPSGPIELSIGFAPGGSTDLIGRAFGREMEGLLSQAMPIVNTPGANGVVAAQELLQAKPDGYTIGIANSSTFTVTPLAASEKEKMVADDFDVLLGMTQDDWVLVANPKSGWSSLDDVKAAGKRITFGTTGAGSGAHLAGLLAFAVAGVEAKDVPFDGDAPAMTAALGGQVDVASVQLAGAYENIKAGKLAPLVIFSAEPSPALPELKTAKDQGYDIAMSQWRLLLAPKGMPEETRTTLADAALKAASAEPFATFCKDNLLQPTVFDSAEITKLVTDAAVKNQELVTKYNIKFGV